MARRTSRTRDGVRISNILRLASIFGAEVREGTSHPYILIKAGLRPCPVASSTDARTMVVPWLRNFMTDRTPSELYDALKSGGYN